MFVQIIEGIVRDRGLLDRQLENWRTEVRPGAIGFLGSTRGVTDDGVAVVVARFTSADDARANGERPEQAAWWAATAPAFEGEVEFEDCDVVDLMLGGGTDQAGFVQVMTGRATDPEAMRAAGRSMEEQLRTSRPDVIGGLVAWHGDRAFTQVVYFNSEAAARAAESAQAGSGADDAWLGLLDGPLAFLDLRHPEFD